MQLIREILEGNKNILTEKEIHEYLINRKLDEENNDLVKYKEFNFINIQYLIYKIDEITNMLSNNRITDSYKELNLLKRNFINDLLDLKYER